jgi:hypothetical protein
MASDLITRTKNFALAIIRLYATLPKTTEAQVLGRQILRSGTSVALIIVKRSEGGLQEIEETFYWLELLGESEIVEKETLAPLRQEADELLAIFVSIVNKTKSRVKSKKG